MTQIPIALQLYTVRESAATDLRGTFSQLAKIGYTNVELAGLYGKSAIEVKALLDEFDLTPVSAHVSLDSFEGDKLGQTVKDYQEIGVETLIVPWIDENARKGPTGFLALAERLNEIGELVNKFGFSFGYHNHGFEFQETQDGKLAIEYLIENTDPSLVTLEIDTGWVKHVDADPVAFITKHGTRISLLHLKDLESGDKSWAPVGSGSLPTAEIIAAAVTAGVRYLVVEQDTTKGPELNAVQASLNFLKANRYA